MSTIIGELIKKKLENGSVGLTGKMYDVYGSREVVAIPFAKKEGDKGPDFKIVLATEGVKVGILWKNKSKKDQSTFLSGFLYSFEKDIRVVAFANNERDGIDKSVDFILYRSDDRQDNQAPAANDPFDVSDGSPAPEYNGEITPADLPF